MTRQNLFSNVWDGDDREAGTQYRVFWRPDDARMGATLYELAPGAPERAGLHTFSNPTDEPVRILAMSAGSFPDVVAYPEDGYAWVATRHPDPKLLEQGGDPGIITRFEIPIE